MVGRVAIIALLVVAQCSGALLEGRSLVDVVELLSHPIMDDYGNEFPAYWMSFDCTSLGGTDCTLSKKSTGDRNRTPETAKAFSMVVEAIRATVGSLLSDPSVNNDALEVVLRALLGPDSIDEFGLHVEDGKGETETNMPNQNADANDSVVGDAAPAPIPLYVIGKSFTAHTFSVHFNMLKAEPYDVIDDGIEDDSGGALQPSRQGDEPPTAMFSKQLVVHMAVPVRASDSELEVIPVDVLIRCNVFEKRLFYQFRCLVQFCPKQSAGHDAHVDGDHFKP